MNPIAIFRTRRRGSRTLEKFLSKNPIFTLIFTLMGIYCIYGAIKKPDLFWESERATKFRKILGDKGATYFYIIVGLFLVIGSIIFILIEYGYIKI